MVLILLAAAIGWGALAFGAVYAWAWPPLLAAAALAGICAWFAAEYAPISRALGISAALTMLAVSVQLVPLDRSVIATISPGTDAMLRQLNLAYGDASAGARHTISVAPEMTATGLVFFACAATVTLGIPRWLTRDRLRQLAGVIAAVGGIIAGAGIVQKAVSPSVIYGVWRPFVGTDPFGPFVNKNHFAGWILMGLPVALGLAVGLLVRGRRHDARDWRDWLLRLSKRENAGAVLAAFASLVMVIALLMSLSRSGIVAAATALAVATATTTRRLPRPVQIAVVAGLAVMALVAIRAVDTERLAYRFTSVGEATYGSRLGMWRDTIRMAQDVPVFGVGIRAYTVASLLYQTGMPDEHVGAAHSDWLQLMAEGGILVGAPALGMLLLLIREAAGQFRQHRLAGDLGTTYWIRCGAATGLFAIFLQSLVEFSLQMPGNVILFATLWAIAIAPLPRPRRYASHKSAPK